MNKIIGIDLGTSNSCVAIVQEKITKVLENPFGNRTTPSIVAFKNDEIIIGEIAKQQAIINPNTICAIKRKIGIEKEITINNQKYSPQEISAYILEYIKNFAQQKIGQEIESAIISVPAYFNDLQKKATINAAQLAGLKVAKIITEPVAAALAYGIDKKHQECVLVYDLGGGTLDVSILKIKNKKFQVLSTSGNNKLGGDDFDQLIIDFLIKEFQKENAIDLSKNKSALQRLKIAAENAKKQLSMLNKTEIALPFISVLNSKPIHFQFLLTRKKLEELIEPLVFKTLKPIRVALQEAAKSYQDIDSILLVGGSSRIPIVQKLIAELFDKKLNHSINPDEVVAIGAAIQGAIINKDIKDVSLIDVVPISIGMGVKGGHFLKIIKANTPIPTKKEHWFTTTINYQKHISIFIFQGERDIATYNTFLGQFLLSGIQSTKKGIPRIKVTFKIDENGIFSASAQDFITNSKKTITLKNNILNDVDPFLNIEDAKENKENDQKKLNEIELDSFQKKQIDDAKACIKKLEKTLENNYNKINKKPYSKKTVTEIEFELETFKQLLAQKNFKGIQKAVRIHKQKMYRIVSWVIKKQQSNKTKLLKTNLLNKAQDQINELKELFAKNKSHKNYDIEICEQISVLQNAIAKKDYEKLNQEIKKYDKTTK